MSSTHLEVMLSPAEFAVLTQRDLSQSVCVVFDVLRATTSMLTALAHGAAGIIPVATVEEALTIRAQRPEVLLAGERGGERITREITGSIDFDLGNSPREFTADRVEGRWLVMTTTNGTRALRACAGARQVLVAGFVNLQAVWMRLTREKPKSLILVAAGTLEEPALEDVLAAGALCERLWPDYGHGHVADGAEIARRLYLAMGSDLSSAMRSARNGRRLLAHPTLSADVPACLQRNIYDFVGEMGREGAVRRSQP